MNTPPTILYMWMIARSIHGFQFMKINNPRIITEE